MSLILNVEIKTFSQQILTACLRRLPLHDIVMTLPCHTYLEIFWASDKALLYMGRFLLFFLNFRNFSYDWLSESESSIQRHIVTINILWKDLGFVPEKKLYLLCAIYLTLLYTNNQVMQKCVGFWNSDISPRFTIFVWASPNKEIHKLIR